MSRKLVYLSTLTLILLFAPPALAADCCQTSGSPGCNNGAIEACVCAQDPYCCDTEWDGLCVNEVSDFGCGLCGAGSGDCCSSNGSPGCQDYGVQSCVCAQDAFCCDTTWDNLCVEEVNDLGCGQCGGGSFCGDGNCDNDESCSNCAQDCGACGGGGDCCAANGTPGCDNAAISACVCAADSYCCETEWDNICVGEVDSEGCGQCGAPADFCPGYGGSSSCCKPDNPCDWADDNICDCEAACSWDAGDCGGGDSCGNGNCAVDEDCNICPEDCGWCGGDGDCCTANDSPGCDNPAIAGCVCEADAYCCETKWDGICVNEVVSEGCGSCESGGPVCGDGECSGGEDCDNCPDDCGPCGGSGSCCEVQETAGCNDPTVQACVCNEDSFCCDFTWDSICVDEVTDLGCGSCGAGGCGDGMCGDGESCLSCPDDCGQCAGTDCCSPHPDPGCDDGAVSDCICAEDSFCCEVEWDEICVNEVTSLGCGQCDAGPACGNGECQGGENCEVCPADCGECAGGGDCCTPLDVPGCSDPTIQACVCALDAYCCETMWDDICVAEVEGEGCGSCQPCVPDCAGKSCGDDGCGGTCGSCPQEESCQNGKCVGGACQPQCAGKQCGDDGCGGSCGSCPGGQQCQNAKCVGGCQPDCNGKQCGNDGCGGTCGQCPPGLFCNNGHCQQECQPDCTGKKCGADGCGGTCGTCPPNFFCSADGHCNAQCQPDCAGMQCGDDGCGGTCGSCPPNQTCTNGHCTSSCLPNCTGKQCGDDGCGGTCGGCPPAQFCNLQGHCIADCTPDCAGKECGGDGCGGACGTCGFTEQCSAGQCVEDCIPSCLGKECGDNGCGGSCGICGQEMVCSPAGVCLSCQPDCQDKQCGDDGCGGSCGECGAKDQCHPEEGICYGPEADIVWNDDPGVDGWGSSDSTFSEECEEGQRRLYGKCVDNDEVTEGDVDSSCSAGREGSGAASLLLLLLATCLLYLRRKKVHLMTS